VDLNDFAIVLWVSGESAEFGTSLCYAHFR
jgi:hypothetical protein